MKRTLEALRPENLTTLLACLTKKKTVFDEILIDQGTADQFLEQQLSTNALSVSAKQVGQNITINMREDFDHSYHFIAAFIEDHVKFHGTRLRDNI